MTTYRKLLLAASSLIAVSSLIAAPAVAQESDRTCTIDTTTDKDTGKPRTSGTGVEVCKENDGSTSVGVGVSGKELEHFLKYPIGQSDKSVAKQVGNAVHNFFHHL